MAQSLFHRFVLVVAPTLVVLSGCAGVDSRRVARTAPESPAEAAESDNHDARNEAVAAEEGSAVAGVEAQVSQEPTAQGEDQVEDVIARAQEEFDLGLKALRVGNPEGARERFDRAVQIYNDSGIPLDQSARLRRAYEKLVEEIAALESETGEEPDADPDAVPSPTEKLDDITTTLTPEQTEEVLEKVAPEAREVSFDIPMVVNEKVLGWIDIFKNRKDFRNSFLGGYERYGWYEKMIHQTLREEGLPSDLIYMAFLESTYKTSAYSRARAKGIWQFMTPTGRQYGLKVDRFVDERSHPEKSTRAAARYMKDLYGIFGDWHLAIAAYNTGAGNIMRAQRRSGKTSYWDLARTKHMRLETKNFVPAILALALISKDPAKYGFDGIRHNPTLTYDTIQVSGATKLSLIAQLSGSSDDEIRFLNPHLRLGVTPPYEKEYEVRVPTGRGPETLTAYQALPESERITRVASTHTVRRGETLASIAARYGVSVRELSAMNGIRNANRISIGTRLTVPSIPGAPVDAGEDRPRRASRPSKYAPYHVVRRGDTLYRISRAYGIPLKNLMAWNGLSESSKLFPGSRLVVGKQASSSAAPRPAPTDKTSPPAGLVSVPGGGEAAPDPAGEKISYRVRRGDNLFRIALKFNTTVENLKAWNKITGDSINAGDVLTIYPN
ncbi:MAG TPA: LysM peptidoglycan-binding domain-containing protein [Candidatus Polarisedimenticolia bacterium]|nr:LysM peptidoglycan-binding domain-containing protein [Candidatus Polarisedimenticolia bacterium]